jgi:hypothetical protein
MSRIRPPSVLVLHVAVWRAAVSAPALLRAAVWRAVVWRCSLAPVWLAAVAGCASPAAVQSPPPASARAEPVSPFVEAHPAVAEPPAQRLEFAEFFEPGSGLHPSQKLRSLVGQRVRLVGFMAQLELPPKGAFYLVPRPVRCDESGAGNADLPLESVLVISQSSAGRVVPFLAGALELTGTFELGNEPDSEGRMSAFRLRLDAS